MIYKECKLFTDQTLISHGYLLESDFSTNHAVDLIRIKLSKWWVTVIMALMMSLGDFYLFYFFVMVNIIVAGAYK